MERLYKGYLYRNIFRDAKRFVRKQVRNIEFDRDYWLHKVGLTTYSPTKTALGGISLLLLGGVAGALLGLALAPKPGAQLRTEVKDRAMKLFERAGAPAQEVPARA
ncbi:MAG: YtxH domain-containing protein [Myxococcales bacterium]|nr:YtxH domain-containing protein [Myxococcales bacterium]